MEVLYMLENIRMPGLNEFMLAVTSLGEETAFLVTAMILFWCVDKYRGYYVMSVGFLGTLANQFLKITCRVPRPWVQDPAFTILEQARDQAGGYSFPSGHSQSAVGTFGSIAYTEKNRWIRIACIAVCVLVPISRMYIGVHFPSDVLVGSGMALVLIAIMHPLMMKNGGKNIPVILAAMSAMAMAFLLYVECWNFPVDIDEENLHSAVKNAYTLIGSLLGMILVYYYDEKKLHFSTEAVWWVQIIKIVLGLLLVLAVKEGFRAPLEMIFGGHMAARAVRYFMVVIAAGILWPMSFPLLRKLEKK